MSGEWTPSWLASAPEFVRCERCQATVGMCPSCTSNSTAIAAFKRTLAQPHMVWAAEQHSVGIDIVKEDQRLRERLKALADLEATMVVK